MSLQALPALLGHGGVGLNDALPQAVVELQRLRITPVAGAAAGAKMDVAAMRSEDTLLSVLQGTAGVYVDDTANCTIQDTHAFGTVTVAAVNADDTVEVNGVTYTFKDTISAINHVKRTAGNNNANAAALAAAINGYENRYDGTKTVSPAVRAVAVNAVVTITAVADGTAGNAITLLSSNGTRLAVTGAGTLTSGTATGGIKSTTNNTSKDMLVFWYDKR